jgi:hypothetical protein
MYNVYEKSADLGANIGMESVPARIRARIEVNVRPISTFQAGIRFSATCLNEVIPMKDFRYKNAITVASAPNSESVTLNVSGFIKFLLWSTAMPAPANQTIP